MELNFDPSTVKETTNFKLAPTGTYKAKIHSTEDKLTNDGVYTYLSIKWQIVDGPHKGLFVTENLHVDRRNDALDPVKDAEQIERNKTTENIAKGKLAEICKCVGINMLARSEQLLSKMMWIDVLFVPASAKFKYDSNDIKKHTAINGGSTLPGTDTAMPSNLPFGK